MSYAEIRSSVHDEEVEDTCMSIAEIRSSVHDEERHMHVICGDKK